MLKNYDISEYLQKSIEPIPYEFVKIINDERNKGIKIGLFSRCPISYMHGISVALGLNDILLVGENGRIICSDANNPPQWHCYCKEDNFIECLSERMRVRLEDIIIKRY